MLGGAPLRAPWGSPSQRPRPSRPWQVRRASSPAGGRGSKAHVARWEPAPPPTFLKGAGPVPTLRETAHARMDGLEAGASLGHSESCDPAVGLTPQELIERQEQRGKMALKRAAKENQLSRESAALKREKMAYAKALGAAASSQAIEQLRQVRFTHSNASFHSSDQQDAGWHAGQHGGAPPQWAERPRDPPSHHSPRVRPLQPRWSDPLGPEEVPLDGMSVGSDGTVDEQEVGPLPDGPHPTTVVFGGPRQPPVVPAEFEKLHRGESVAEAPSAPSAQLDRALERGRAAEQRRHNEALASASQAEERRRQREHAREVGSAASLLAIEQMRREEQAAADVAALGAALGSPAPLQGPPDDHPCAARSPFSGATGLAIARPAQKGVGFGSSSARPTSVGGTVGSAREAHRRADSPVSRRAASPARAISPRLLRPTAASKRMFEEVGRGGAGGARKNGSSAPPWNLSASALSRATPSATTGAPSARSNEGRPTAAVGLAAVHELAAALSPTELYRKLSHKRAASADVLARRGRPSATASPGVRAATRAAANALVRSTGGNDLSARTYAPTPSEAARSIQSGYRGMVGRGLARREAASTALQRCIRSFLARRRRKHATNRARLYEQRRAGTHWSRRAPSVPADLSGAAGIGAEAARLPSGGARLQSGAEAAHEGSVAARLEEMPASLKGRWAERNPSPVTRLPMSRSLAKAPDSPRGRPAHQRLHQGANERQERQRQRSVEQEHRDEVEFVTACTFSPMTNNKQGRFKEVSGKVDTRWKAPPRSASLGRSSSSPRIAPAGTGDAGAAKELAASVPHTPSSSEQGWTTVATTVATGHGARPSVPHTMR